MKVTFVGEEKNLEVGKNYKVRGVKRVDKSFFYKIELESGITKWIDSRNFKYPMKWIK